MKKISILLFTTLFLLIISSEALFAQKEANIWYFGEYAGLNFNNGSPIAISNSAMSTQEGCTSVSDSNGNLLFYSDGITVWNRNHQAMPNGTGLMGHKSAFQSVIAVPKPGSSSIYYIFTVDAIENNLQNGLRYSILDMSSAGGLGAITTKNVLMEPSVTERLTVVRHANNQDYWIIVHKWNSNAFSSYLLTSNGLNKSLASTAGVTHTGSMLNAVGAVKASPEGTRLALGIRGMSIFEVFDFNKTTGVISNAITSPAIFPNSIGVEFSPDGTKLYGAVAQNNEIYQFDLTQPNFFTKGRLIAISDNFTCAMQIGPDGKIYTTRRQSNYIGVINNPNALGTASNYVDNGIFLGNNRFSWFGLPSFLPNLFYKPTTINTFNFTNTCFNNSTAFSIPGDITGYSFVWNFGDPASGAFNSTTEANPVHKFSAAGTYKVKLDATVNGNKNTIEKEVVIKSLPQVNLGNDITLCIGQTQVLAVSEEPSTTYIWQNGTAGTNFTVTQPGTYWVEATRDGCTSRDEIIVNYQVFPVVNIGNDTTLCTGSTLILNAKNPGLSYNWQDGSVNQTFEVKQAGIYWVDVRNNTGCITRDSINIIYLTPPVVDLGKDTVLCQGQSLTVGNYIPGASYLWQDGSIKPYLTVTKPGKYWLKSSINVCSESDTISIQYQQNPPLVFSGDTTLCYGSKLLLQANNLTGASYLWQDGTTAASYIVNKPGIYSLTIRQNSCTTTSTIQVTFDNCTPLIPNIITPNADTYNETFFIKNIDTREWQLEIYNRWGQVIYRTEQYNNDWNAKGIPDGVYYYKLSHRQIRQAYKGYVEVLR